MVPYIGFLRGINVGGNAIIKMADLAKVFESLKFKNVRTFIASGNVLFETPEADAKALEAKIEKALKKAFGIEIAVMLRTRTEIQSILKRDPFGKKTADSNWKLYVVFMKDKPDAAAVRALSALNGEMETYEAAGREVFCAVHKNHPKPTFSGNFIEKHLKTRATARNWNTVVKVAALQDQKGEKN